MGSVVKRLLSVLTRVMLVILYGITGRCDIATRQSLFIILLNEPCVFWRFDAHSICTVLSCFAFPVALPRCTPSTALHQCYLRRTSPCFLLFSIDWTAAKSLSIICYVCIWFGLLIPIFFTLPPRCQGFGICNLNPPKLRMLVFNCRNSKAEHLMNSETSDPEE